MSISMLSTFMENCENFNGEQCNDSMLYGLVVSCGLWAGNGDAVNPCEEVHKEAQGVWSDFANDFSCLPNTGIWSEVFKDEKTMESLSDVGTVENFYAVLFDFVKRHIELFN